MNRKVAITLFAAIVNVAIAAASAQTIAKADIPFSFRVGSALMPAGEYDIKPADSGVVWIREVNGRSSAVALALTNSGSTAAPTKLVFNRYGDQYFLHELSQANGEPQMTFSKSKLEKRVQQEEAYLPQQGQTLVALK